MGTVFRNVRSVRAPRGFYRCGRRFGAEGEDCAVSAFTPEEWARLEAEPHIAVGPKFEKGKKPRPKPAEIIIATTSDKAQGSGGDSPSVESSPAPATSAAASGEPDPAPAAAGDDSLDERVVRARAIAAAAEALDPENDEHWTRGGAPNLNLMRRATGERYLKRAECDAAGVTRDGLRNRQ